MTELTQQNSGNQQHPGPLARRCGDDLPRVVEVDVAGAGRPPIWWSAAVHAGN